MSAAPRLLRLLALCLALVAGQGWAQTTPVQKKPAARAKTRVRANSAAKSKTGGTTKPKPKTTAKPKPVSPKPVPPVVIDTAIARADTSLRPDSVINANDIESTVVYNATDSIVFSAKTRQAKLYGAADVTYGDINLKAEEINVDYQSGMVDAQGRPDSVGKLIGQPVFTQGSENYQAKKMRYNFKSRKGLIREVITKQGDGYLHGQVVKRENETAFYVKNAEYTTCNLEHPHFYIKSYKLKMIPGKKLISGPFDLHIADVPTPLGFAFGFFPIPQYRSSGIIIPTYGETADRGFFLRNGGYYFGISDYFDIKLLGEIYTRGGWGIYPQSTYRKRYKYNGFVDLRYIKRTVDLLGESAEFDDFAIQWTHTPIALGKSSRFSASVNIQTNGNNQRNSFNTTNIWSTNFNSTVTYAKTFPGTPFSLAASARVTQNTATREITTDLPTFAFNMARVYPFKAKRTTKSNIITNLNVSYQLDSRNTISNRRINPPSNVQGVRLLIPALATTTTPTQVSTVNGSEQTGASTAGQVTYAPTDGSQIIPLTLGSLPLLLRQAQQGVQHTVPVNTSFQVGRYFNINPSFNYTEKWYPKSIRYRRDDARDGYYLDTSRRFSRVYNYSASVSATTQIYGIYQIKGRKLEAIRHRVNPSIGYSYRPDFSDPIFGFYQRVPDPTLSNQQILLDPYLGFIYGGGGGAGRTSAMTFSLTNSVEAKFRNTSDTASKNPFVKKSLLDNLSLGGSYNFAADSFKLSDISITANTRILDKVTLAASAILNPYSLENRPVVGGGL